MAAPDKPLPAYYRQAIRPLIKKHLTAGRLAIYDRSVALFEQFAGANVTIGQVDEERLTDFIESTELPQHSAKHRRELAGCVRTIVRQEFPELLQPARAREDLAPPPAADTLAEYFETVYRPQCMFDRSPHAQQCTRRSIRRLHEHFGRDLKLSELSDSIAATHLGWLRGQGLAPSTINRERAEIFAVWRHAHAAGLVGCEPRVKKLRVAIDEPDAWTVDELARIFATAEHFRGYFRYGKIRGHRLWPALLRVAWYTGVRRGSLLSIQTEDVDLREGWIRVRGEHMKNGRGKRFRIGPDAVAAVRRIYDRRRPLLFGDGIELSRLNTHFDELLAQADVARSSRKGFNKWHKLRRTAATHMAAAAGEHAASSLLGHSSLAVTDRYLDRSQLAVDAAAVLPAIPSTAPPPRKPK